MLVTLKNLQHQTFTIEIADSETVKTLKEKIESLKGAEYPAEGQKLIYSGKILADDSQLKEYSIDESKFIVVMVSKPKVVSAPPPSNPPPQPTPVEKEQPSTPSTATTTAPTVSTPSSGQTTTNVTTNEGVLLTGTEFQKTVDSIMAMGYEKADVEKALRASFNNPDRAVEYLINGIPPEITQENPAQSEGGNTGTEGNTGSGGTATNDPLGFLRSQPQFDQMRQVVRGNPQYLNALLTQIGQTNPALLQVISENQEEFVRLLNEDSPPSSSGSSTGSAGRDPNAASYQIQITPQDKEAIERLKSLGFPEHLVVQAYFACEKNETLAANFLLSADDD